MQHFVLIMMNDVGDAKQIRDQCAWRCRCVLLWLVVIVAHMTTEIKLRPNNPNDNKEAYLIKSKCLPNKFDTKRINKHPRYRSERIILQLFPTTSAYKF